MGSRGKGMGDVLSRKMNKIISGKGKPEEE